MKTSLALVAFLLTIPPALAEAETPRAIVAARAPKARVPLRTRLLSGLVAATLALPAMVGHAQPELTVYLENPNQKLITYQCAPHPQHVGVGSMHIYHARVTPYTAPNHDDLWRLIAVTPATKDDCKFQRLSIILGEGRHWFKTVQYQDVDPIKDAAALAEGLDIPGKTLDRTGEERLRIVPGMGPAAPSPPVVR